jgi:hypothetical protein
VKNPLDKVDLNGGEKIQKRINHPVNNGQPKSRYDHPVGNPKLPFGGLFHPLPLSDRATFGRIDPLFLAVTAEEKKIDL